jgi:uncharacterized NAD(P)/FAD-binding protein YdhS
LIVDAARPAIAGIWRNWSTQQKKQSLRHARPYWDAHRHRIPEDLATRVAALMQDGQLRIIAGRPTETYVAAGDLTAIIAARRARAVSSRRIAHHQLHRIRRRYASR